MGKTRKLSRGSRKHGKKLVGKRMEKKNEKYGKKRTYRRRKLMGKKWGGVKVESKDGKKIKVTSEDEGKTLSVNGLIFKLENICDGENDDDDCEGYCYPYQTDPLIGIWIKVTYDGTNWVWLNQLNAVEFVSGRTTIRKILFTYYQGNKIDNNSLPNKIKLSSTTPTTPTKLTTTPRTTSRTTKTPTDCNNLQEKINELNKTVQNNSSDGKSPLSEEFTYLMANINNPELKKLELLLLRQKKDCESTSQ